MSFDFEHWHDGKVYLHQDNWNRFKQNIENGGDYPHNWDHSRIFLKLDAPRKLIKDVPVGGLTVQSADTSYSIIYEPFPAFVRSEEDPEGWLPSWHIFAENNHIKPMYAKPFTILTLSKIGTSMKGYQWPETVDVAFFDNLYWRISDYKNYDLGPNPPPKKNKKKKRYRDIFDE